MQRKEETAEMETQRQNVHAETLHADETPPLKDFEQKNEQTDHLQEMTKDDSNGEAPVWEHIGELRHRLLKCVAAVVVCFACLMYVGPQRIMDLVTAPVKKEGVQFIYLGLADVLYVQMKVVFLCAVILASPVLLWQLWAFVRPALYPEEKKLALGWTFLSLFLFVLGVTFGYVAVFSSALSFFVYVGVDTALPLLLSGRKEAGAGMDVSVPVPFCFGCNLWLCCGVFFCSQLFCICGSRYGAAIAGPRPLCFLSARFCAALWRDF